MMSESVTVTVQNGSNRPSGQQGSPTLIMNPEYFRSLPGLLKLVQLILGIICMALSGPNWYVFVCAAAFVITLVWSVIYFFSIRELLNLPVNWILTELFNTAIWTILYFTAFITVISTRYHIGAGIAASVFSILNTLVYAVGTYFLYLEYKN